MRRRRNDRGRDRLVVGLTGGVGSGKSTVLALLARAGVSTADADAIVRRALAPGGRAVSAVRRTFGPKGLSPAGGADRRWLAGRAFRDVRARRRLEKILHPVVEREMRRIIRSHRRGLLVLDIPLLFETGMERLVDRTVVVWAPAAVRRRRVARSGRLTAADARRRMAAQMPLLDKRRRADAVIDNRGTRAVLRREVRRVFLGPRALLYKPVSNS